MSDASTRNGTLPSDARSAAAYYLGRGVVPVPVPRTGRRKAPVLEGWQDLRPTTEDLDSLFPEGVPFNVGLLLGEPSGGLIERASPDERVQVEKPTLAISYLARYPDWSMSQIARAVGVSRQTLYKWREFREVCERLRPRGTLPPRGHRTRDGRVEAYQLPAGPDE